MPENCPLLSIWEERNTGAISVFRGVSLGVLWRIQVWFPNRETKAQVSPRTECSCVFFAGYNITSASIYRRQPGIYFRFYHNGVCEVADWTLSPLCACSLQSAVLEGTEVWYLDGSFPCSSHPLQPKVTGLHSTNSSTPKWILHSDVILRTETLCLPSVFHTYPQAWQQWAEFKLGLLTCLKIWF